MDEDEDEDEIIVEDVTPPLDSTQKEKEAIRETQKESKDSKERRCDAAGCRKPGAKLRCSKCKACYFCDLKCQRKSWAMHKRVCSDDPLLRKYIAIEMGFERAASTMIRLEPPLNVACSICKRYDRKLLHGGCACRKDSAGWLHVDCLDKEETKYAFDPDRETAVCSLCKQSYTGLFDLQFLRKRWRASRTLDISKARPLYYILSANASLLQSESECVEHFLAEAKRGLPRGDPLLIFPSIQEIDFQLKKDHDFKKAMHAFEALLPLAVKHAEDYYTCLYQLQIHLINIYCRLDRQDLALSMSKNLHGIADTLSPKDSNESINALFVYASVLAFTDRLDESKPLFDQALSRSQDAFGPNHTLTKTIKFNRIKYFSKKNSLPPSTRASKFITTEHKMRLIPSTEENLAKAFVPTTINTSGLSA